MPEQKSNKKRKRKLPPKREDKRSHSKIKPTPVKREDLDERRISDIWR